MCMWGRLDKHIRVATWPPKQKFLALPLPPWLLTFKMVRKRYEFFRRRKPILHVPPTMPKPIFRLKR